jgi:hypothetical protein
MILHRVLPNDTLFHRRMRIFVGFFFNFPLEPFSTRLAKFVSWGFEERNKDQDETWWNFV